MFADAQQKSFQKLNDLLTRAEALAYFKNECRTIVADTGSTGSHPAARINVKSSFPYTKKSYWCGKENKKKNSGWYEREFELQTDYKRSQNTYN